MAIEAKTNVPSVRLTGDMRRGIVRQLVDHALAKREAAHTADEFKLALKAYNARYTPAQRKKLDELPKGWLPTDDDIPVSFGQGRIRLHFGPQNEKTFNRPTKVFPHSHIREEFILEPRSELAVAIAAWRDAGAALKAERAALQAKAEGIVESVSTTNRLIEVWPEAAPFVPKSAQPRLLPVVQREELNAAFGLPAA